MLGNVKSVDVGGPGAWDFAGPAEAAPAGGAIIGYRDAGGAGLDLRVSGTTAITVLIAFGECTLVVDEADGHRTLDGFAVGLAMAPMRVRSERTACVELRLSPTQAYALGIPLTELGRGVVALDDLWGTRAHRLREQLTTAQTWDERFAVTNSFLAQCDISTRAPDAEILVGWNRILASAGRLEIGALAASLGWSRKRLSARFEPQIGLTPKRAAMLVRYRHAVDGLLAGRPAADVAVECGYTDQAHLCRDVGIFADHTPGSLTTNYRPSIARHRYRAWGKSFQYGAGPVGR